MNLVYNFNLILMITTVGKSLYLWDCEVGNEHQTRMENANSSWAECRDDKERTCSDIEKYFAIYMQKVIMLPVLMGVKSCIFTKRLTTYHLGRKENYQGKAYQRIMASIDFWAK